MTSTLEALPALSEPPLLTRAVGSGVLTLGGLTAVGALSLYGWASVLPLLRYQIISSVQVGLFCIPALLCLQPLVGVRADLSTTTHALLSGVEESALLGLAVLPLVTLAVVVLADPFAASFVYRGYALLLAAIGLWITHSHLATQETPETLEHARLLNTGWCIVTLTVLIRTGGLFFHTWVLT